MSSHRSVFLAALLSLALLPAALSAQVAGEPPQSGADGSAPVASSWQGPLNVKATVPAAYASTFGNTSNVYPLGRPVIRYQQVFLGSELPTVQPSFGLGMRHDDVLRATPGTTLDIEVRLGYTTMTPATLSTTFDNNFDVKTPAAVTVFPRAKFTIPDVKTVATNPQLWQVQIPFKVPFVWTQSSGRNLLVEIRIYGNSSNSTLAYYVDAASGSSATTSRVYSTASATATTGTKSTSYGAVMSLLQKVKTTAEFLPFGKGCPGTGGKPGVVLPSAAKTQMGNYNNYYGVSYLNQRYHQIFDGSQVGLPRTFLGHSLRMRAATYAGGSQTLELMLSNTKTAPASISTTFASNISGTQTTVFSKKTYVYPPMVSNNNPAKFGIDFKYDKPWAWVPKTGEHLLVEVRNHSTSSVSYFVDAMQNDTSVSRLWGTGVTAATGTTRAGQGLIMRFNYQGIGNDVPVLTNTGRPVLGQSFTADLRSARANAAAGLAYGFSTKTWGSIPLPFDLAPLGASGCQLLLSFDGVAAAVVADAAGDANVKVSIPNIPSLNGLQWHYQYFVLDAGANGLGLAFSNGATVKIGEQ